MAREEDLSLTVMHKICEKAGAERVSQSASMELAKILDEIGVKIVKEALDYALYAGRRTLKAKDVKMAASKLFEKKLTT